METYNLHVNVVKTTKHIKFHPRRGHKDQDKEYRYTSTLSLTSALDGVGGKRQALATLHPGKDPGTHCLGGLEGPRAGMNGCGKFHPHRDSIPRKVQPEAMSYPDPQNTYRPS